MTLMCLSAAVFLKETSENNIPMHVSSTFTEEQ